MWSSPGAVLNCHLKMFEQKKHQVLNTFAAIKSILAIMNTTNNNNGSFFEKCQLKKNSGMQPMSQWTCATQADVCRSRLEKWELTLLKGNIVSATGEFIFR